MTTIIYALALLGCLRGPDVPTVTRDSNVGAYCQAYDLDGDHRVDLFDVAELQVQSTCIFETFMFRPMGRECR